MYNHILKVDIKYVAGQMKTNGKMIFDN